MLTEVSNTPKNASFHISPSISQVEPSIPEVNELNLVHEQISLEYSFRLLSTGVLLDT